MALERGTKKVFISKIFVFPAGNAQYLVRKGSQVRFSPGNQLDPLTTYVFIVLYFHVLFLENFVHLLRLQVT